MCTKLSPPGTRTQRGTEGGGRLTQLRVTVADLTLYSKNEFMYYTILKGETVQRTSSPSENIFV